MASTLDSLGRGLSNLRLSVTDRCNLRCAYCMPEAEYVWLPGDEILSFEELSTLVDRFMALGVRKVRHALIAGLCADAVGLGMSVVIGRLMFT